MPPRLRAPHAADERDALSRSATVPDRDAGVAGRIEAPRNLEAVDIR